MSYSDNEVPGVRGVRVLQIHLTSLEDKTAVGWQLTLAGRPSQ